MHPPFRNQVTRVIQNRIIVVATDALIKHNKIEK